MIEFIEFEKTWEAFGEISINDNDEIEERFLHFPIGTNRSHVWNWFEDAFDIVLGDRLNSNNGVR